MSKLFPAILATTDTPASVKIGFELLSSGTRQQSGVEVASFQVDLAVDSERKFFAKFEMQAAVLAFADYLSAH